MDKIIITAGIVLLAWALWQTIQKVRGKAKRSCCGSAEAVSINKVEDTDPSHYPYQYRLQIDHMHCSSCARNVENLINSLSGVWCKVNLGKKEATVLSKEQLNEKIFREALQDSEYKLVNCTVSKTI